MVVVFLTHNYPRAPGDLPGSFLHPLALALRTRGHDVRIVAPSDRGQGGRESLDGVPVRRVRYASSAGESLAYSGTMQDAVRSPGGLLRLARLVRALRQGARAEAADHPSGRSADPVILHAHWWFPAGFAAPPELPMLVTLHGTDGRLLRERWAGRWIGRRVLGRARVVTAVSPELAQTAESVSGRTDIARHVQAMPVDAGSWPLSRGGGGLVAVARLTDQKRVHLAIRAAEALAADGLALPLTIIGDGPERATLEKDAGQRGLPPVRFLGTRPHSEVIGLLASADVMLFTARAEGFGLSAIEALMVGVPVVACRDGGGVVSALDRHGGGVVVEAHPSELAQAIRKASTSVLREQAREAGRQWRAELAPAHVAERFETWYGEALAR